MLLHKLRLPVGALSLLAVAVASIFALTALPPSVHGAGDNKCHVAIVVDRSGSVGGKLTRNPDGSYTKGTDYLTPSANSPYGILRGNIVRLFQPGPTTGINDPNIDLAFWSFSDNGSNSPNSVGIVDGDPLIPVGFVSSTKENSDFENRLMQIQAGGGTNYQEGFSGPASIIDKASVILFMTDGVPNTPKDINGFNTDDQPNDPRSPSINLNARNAARAAAQSLQDSHKVILGILIGSSDRSSSDYNDPSSLQYAINGNLNASSGTYNGVTVQDVMQIPSDYSKLTETIKQLSVSGCAIANPYNLHPGVTINGSQTGGTVSYNIKNESSSMVSKDTSWSISRFIVPAGQSVNSLTSSNQDNLTCDQLRHSVNASAACQVLGPGGHGAFQPGDSNLDSQAGSDATALKTDDAKIGENVCYVLIITQPTPNSSPTNRSQTACVTMGKSPTVQVLGGDLKVGRYFALDPSKVSTQQAEIRTNLITGTDGKTYGSWGQYAAMAPGTVEGFASYSGLQGGASSNSQSSWSALTFANVDNTYGSFTSGNVGMGTIPNVASALINNNSPVPISGTTFDPTTSDTGFYELKNSSLTITGSATIGAGKSIIIYVPDGTATITSDIKYDDGPYNDISQIPQLVIIASNINIDPGVGRLDAWLIADGTASATDGTVSTCDDPSPLTVNTCNQQLTINGPIMARHLSLRRTYNGSGSSNDVPAEMINLSAANNLWSQYAGTAAGRAVTTYTTELPPYF